MWRMKGPILYVLWMDKKAVWVAGIVTSAPPANLPEVQRRAKDGTVQAVTCPPLFQPTTSTWVGSTRMTR